MLCLGSMGDFHINMQAWPTSAVVPLKAGTASALQPLAF